MDNWKHRSSNMKCKTCMWFVVKDTLTVNCETACTSEDPKQQISCKKEYLGRCRRHAPSANGFVPIFENDWCGDHRLDENKI